MSLISFHRGLIVAAIVFCLGFAGWQLRAYLADDGASGGIALALVFALLGIALMVYLARLKSFLKLED